jgi:hypothetical protein
LRPNQGPEGAQHREAAQAHRGHVAGPRAGVRALPGHRHQRPARGLRARGCLGEQAGPAPRRLREPMAPSPCGNVVHRPRCRGTQTVASPVKPLPHPPPRRSTTPSPRRSRTTTSSFRAWPGRSTSSSTPCLATASRPGRSAWARSMPCSRRGRTSRRSGRRWRASSWARPTSGCSCRRTPSASPPSTPTTRSGAKTRRWGPKGLEGGPSRCAVAAVLWGCGAGCVLRAAFGCQNVASAATDTIGRAPLSRPTRTSCAPPPT